MSMYTSLDRFRIKPGKEDLAREWFRYLNDHLAEANATMPAEGAHIESWFLHEESDGLYGYVYVIYDDNDKAVEVFKESENPLDIKHNEYMNACIDYHDYAEMKPAVALGDYSVFRRWLVDGSSTPLCLQTRLYNLRISVKCISCTNDLPGDPTCLAAFRRNSSVFGNTRGSRQRVCVLFPAIMRDNVRIMAFRGRCTRGIALGSETHGASSSASPPGRKNHMH